MDISLCFIISCKVYKNYKSHLVFYVNNIKTFYPEATILLVDNNSLYGKEFYKQFQDIKNVICLENTNESKFEVGAYNYGIEYILQNNLFVDYYVFIQDTFVLIKYYDFNTLKENSINACPIGTFLENNKIGCWCNSFICSNQTLKIFYDSTKEIILRNRTDSISSERWLGPLLLELNNKIPYSIVGDHMDSVRKYRTEHAKLIYDIDSEEIKQFEYCFVKECQQKNERTLE